MILKKKIQLRSLSQSERSVVGSLSGLMLLLYSGVAFAGDVELQELKAAFLLRFVQFVEMPVEDRDKPIVVVANSLVFEHLKRMTESATAHGTALKAKFASEISPSSSCDGNVYFIERSATSERSLSHLSACKALIVTFGGPEREAGSVIHLYLDGDHLSFRVSVKEMKQRNLVIHPRLLSLADSQE